MPKEMTDNKIYSFIGLATKAGKITTGEESCERAIKNNKAKLVIVAEDASDNTKKSFKDGCTYRNVSIRFFGQKETLGKFAGKEKRAVAVISDTGFAKRLIEMIDNREQKNGGI